MHLPDHDVCLPQTVIALSATRTRPICGDCWMSILPASDRSYDEQFQAKCGDLQEGFAGVRCERLPSRDVCRLFPQAADHRCPPVLPASEKRTLLTAAEEVCGPISHRQVVLTIPKWLRLHTRFARRSLGKLSHSVSRLHPGGSPTCWVTDHRFATLATSSPTWWRPSVTHGEQLH